MTTTPDTSSDAARLDSLQHQHRLTLRVLAVAIEQLLRATNSEQIVMSEEALARARALSVWRDRVSCHYVLTVAP